MTPREKESVLAWQRERLQLRKTIRAKKKAKKTRNPVKPIPNYKPKKGETYTHFLRSQYWHTIRLMVLDRDEHNCTVCESKTHLQVHHKTYAHHLSEHKHLSDLITLCESCHKKEHEILAVIAGLV